MSQATRVLAINGSYRVDGITDQAVRVAADSLSESGVEVETIVLREHSIEFA